MAGAETSREDVRALFLDARAKAPRPVVITPQSDVDPRGALDCDIEKGSLFLKKGHTHYRVLLEPEATPMLEPGSYVLFGYRIKRTAEDGSQWFVSTTGARGVPLEVQADTEQELLIDQQVLTDLNLRRLDGGKIAITLAVRGPGLKNKPSMSVYQNGKRVPARYEVLTVDDEVLVSGKLEYG